MNDYDNQMQPVEYIDAPADNSQDPNSLYADYMREDKVKNVIQQLNPDNLVEDIEHRIRGEKKNRYTEEWELIDKEQKNRVSEKLISRYISFLSSILNQNTSLSNYSASEINNLMGMIIEYIRDDLSDNCEEYGFTYINEIEVTTNVKQLIRKTMPNGNVGIMLIERPAKQKRIVEEVVDFNEMTRIGMIICGTTFSVLKRAQNGAEARRVFGALRVQESLNPQQQKKGVMDFLKFWQ